jgi:hypothetical protein
VSAARKREAFSTAFAHGCEAIFKLSINLSFTLRRLIYRYIREGFEISLKINMLQGGVSA